MFSRTVEYALRAIVHLADQAPRACTTGSIAEATKVPPAYLSKVLQNLATAGLVSSRRGVGGGMTLAIDAAELTVLDVVEAVDPIRRIDTCPLGIASHGAHLCALHEKLDGALSQVEDALRASTVAEILADPNPSVPLCDGRPHPDALPDLSAEE